MHPSSNEYKTKIVRKNIENAVSGRAFGYFFIMIVLAYENRITFSSWKVLGFTLCSFWCTCNFDCKGVISKTCTPHLYIVIAYWNINETRISAKHIIKSAGYTRSVRKILRHSVEFLSPWLFWNKKRQMYFTCIKNQWHDIYFLTKRSFKDFTARMQSYY